MAKLKPKDQFVDPARGPLLSPRWVISLVLMALGIAWLAYYYVGVRAPDGFDTETGKPFEATGLQFMQDLGDWNYLIGFGIFFVGLIAAAHPSTPLGRGTGVVVGMLACFVIGLLWICTFYVISDYLSVLPVFNDLGQKNLFVGIVFMAVGFVFATKWE